MKIRQDKMRKRIIPFEGQGSGVFLYVSLGAVVHFIGSMWWINVSACWRVHAYMYAI